MRKDSENIIKQEEIMAFITCPVCHHTDIDTFGRCVMCSSPFEEDDKTIDIPVKGDETKIVSFQILEDCHAVSAVNECTKAFGSAVAVQISKASASASMLDVEVTTTVTSTYWLDKAKDADQAASGLQEMVDYWFPEEAGRAYMRLQRLFQENAELYRALAAKNAAIPEIVKQA
jgi:hypothetical protein